jgi:hypothetical protein
MQPTERKTRDFIRSLTSAKKPKEIQYIRLTLVQQYFKANEAKKDAEDKDDEPIYPPNDIEQEDEANINNKDLK